MSVRRAAVLAAILGLLLGCDDGAQSELDATLERGAVDWSFAADLPSVVIQTSSPPRARAVWLVVADRALYVPSGLAHPARERDELSAVLEADPAVVLRVGDELYLRHAIPVEDFEAAAALWDRIGAKYATHPGVPPGGRIYRLDPATRS